MTSFKKYAYILFLSLLIVFAVALPAHTNGQVNVNIPGALKNELSVEVIPEYPGPYENTSINLSLYTDDLNSAHISWFNNGKLVSEGVGKTSYIFKTGAVGQETRIDVVVVLKNGISFNRFYTITPAGVEVVWEADSYTLPFYQGKALHPKQGRLKLSAFPEFIKNGKTINPDNLIYTWQVGEDVIQSQSGYGRKVAIINGNILGGAENVHLTVSDPTNNITAEKYIDVETADPEILLYENSPYYGLNTDTAIKPNSPLKESELQILAAPFFMTIDGNNITYTWRINGQNKPDLENSRSAVFRKPDDNKSGRSIINIEASNLKRVLQFAERNVIINY